MLLLDELKALAKDRTLVSVNREDFSDQQLTGTVIEANEDFVYMTLCDDNGRFDGYTVFPLSQVTEVFWDTRVHRALSVLVADNDVTLPDLELTSLESILLQLKERFEAVCLMDNNDEDHFDIAEIIAIDDGWLKSRCLGTKKTLSKFMQIQSINTCSRIEFDSPYINNIIKLHKRSDL